MCAELTETAPQPESLCTALKHPGHGMHEDPYKATTRPDTAKQITKYL